MSESTSSLLDLVANGQGSIKIKPKVETQPKEDAVKQDEAPKAEEKKPESKGERGLICPQCGHKLIFMREPGKAGMKWMHTVNEKTKCRLTFKNEAEIEEYIKEKEQKEEEQKVKAEILPEVEITAEITLSQYDSVGGDTVSLEQLLKGIDKIFNNVDRHAFDLVEDEEPDDAIDKPDERIEESVKQDEKKHIVPRLSSSRLKSRLKRNEEEEDVEKRAHVKDGSITITTTYSPEEAAAKAAQAKEKKKVDPYIIYNDQAYAIKKPSDADFFIGRTSENDIVVNVSAVSSRHAIIKKISGRYYLQDISTNGTIIENEQGRFKAPKGKLVEITSKTKIILPGANMMFIC